MRKTVLLSIALLATTVLQAQDLKLNDLEYFERQGVNVLVFSNSFNGGFNDEKNSGIEIIHHGVRTVQGGAVRLNNTPEQWDLVPKMTNRKVDKENGSIEVTMRYDDYDFESRAVVTAKGNAVEIAVWLDKPVPDQLAGEAGFNLEFLPSQYWLKTFIMDGRLNRFPRYATSQTVTRPNSEKPRQFKGFKTYDDRGTDRFVDPLPLETGHRIVMATDDPERMIAIQSDDAELKLYDGRMLAQNGWFVLRSVLPKGKTGKVVTWTVEPHAIPGWIRQPNIGFSQIGYTPEQPKVAVIELDKNDTPLANAVLMRIKEDGTTEQAFQDGLKLWGPYFKYNYVKFDFSQVRQPGVYYIQYGSTKTNDFLIDEHVYDKITDATTDVWVPIHMNHMYVTEGYRTWHGEPFKEGYLQAPESDHFDLHRQGAKTDTKYKPLELIPGLNVGGFFDAGDFDIETGSNISVVQNFIRTWELFHPQRDETFVSQQQRYVELHRPDGVPDILQFIEHGVLNLVTQAEQIGHMASTLSNSVLDNYHHLGDAASITDGLHYDPSLKPYEVSADGKRSGTPDDMWAFTNRNPSLDLQAAGVFTSAARVLRGYNDALADRALKQADRLRKEAEQLQANRRRPRGRQNNRQGSGDLQAALDSIPMKDAAYRESLIPRVREFADYIKSFDTQNPYGVPIGLGNWAGVNAVLNFGITVNYAHIYFPDIISKAEVYRVSNWLYGCHPYHNYSFVAVVGAARPKQVFYGNNRADFSAIPGNVAPGLLFRKPDHFENYDDWPFLWGQNEGTIAGNTQYIIFGSALKNIVGKKVQPVSGQRGMRVRKNVPTDSIRLSDPAVLADKKTNMYYMTGTGGMMWRSVDLKLWEGPFRVTEFEADSWMGPRPMIWAAELHQTGDGKYYYFATFTNQAVKIDSVRGNVIERRASQVLRADNPMGPYRAFGDATYLPADRPTLDGTFWRDKDGKPYLVFCGEWLQNWNGTIEKIELKPDLSGTVGEPKVLFRASDSPWSRERDDQGNVTWNKVTDGPWLFRTGTGRLGMLWTSWVFGDYTQGVAYSESGTLDGPWVQEPEPITPPNYGHSMLFQRFDGQWVMSVHSHAKDGRGRTVRIPHFFEVDLSGDKLRIKK